MPELYAGNGGVSRVAVIRPQPLR
ncbi:uncharacterized protein METZ01_LOCUS159005, partial [marine metagenome]